MSLCDLDLNFDLTVVTLTFKILSGKYLSEIIKCRRLMHGRDMA